MNIEKLRLSYKPKNIELLFIGESPPANETFFYENSLMGKYTCRAFEKALDTSFPDYNSFLNFFSNIGCYLDDLSQTPVNQMSTRERVKIIKDSVANLASRLEAYRPEVIIIALKKIERYAKEAISSAGLQSEVYTLPFAGNGHQNKYVENLTAILEKHIKVRHKTLLRQIEEGSGSL